MTEMQQHIARHLRGGSIDPAKSIDSQVSLFNMDCFVGMIETGEATYDDFAAVGGVVLVAAVAKSKQNRDDAKERT